MRSRRGRKPKEGTLTPSQRANAFNQENYDRLGIFIPKGQKEILKAKAQEMDFSLNDLTNRLYGLFTRGEITLRMLLTDEEWEEENRK